MQYKSGAPRNLREIGQQLGVAHVLEGSVQRAANKMRVNAQLIDARNDAHLWAQTYDRDLADVFAIQSEIAKTIADQLQAKLSPNEKRAIEQPPTTDLAAFDLYSRAKTFSSPASSMCHEQATCLQAIDYLNRRSRAIPHFSRPIVSLSMRTNTLRGVVIIPRPARARPKLLYKRQRGCGQMPRETHLARATHLYSALRDYTARLAELEIARRPYQTIHVSSN